MKTGREPAPRAAPTKQPSVPWAFPVTSPIQCFLVTVSSVKLLPPWATVAHIPPTHVADSDFREVTLVGSKITSFLWLNGDNPKPQDVSRVNQPAGLASKPVGRLAGHTLASLTAVPWGWGPPPTAGIQPWTSGLCLMEPWLPAAAVAATWLPVLGAPIT